MLPEKMGTRLCLTVLFLISLNSVTAQAGSIRYVAIGDSYTICEGVAKTDCWPTLLTKNLAAAGIEIELAANPARTGWRVQEAIENELPVFAAANPEFATLLIGVNDWVRGSGRKKFTAQLGILMDRMLAKLPTADRLLVITIPDFSCAPESERYGYGRNIAKGISAYNNIIKGQAKKRGLPVVDLFPLSQKFCDRPEMFVEDGIHPSAKQYALWEGLIFPQALKILNR